MLKEYARFENINSTEELSLLYDTEREEIITIFHDTSTYGKSSVFETNPFFLFLCNSSFKLKYVDYSILDKSVILDELENREDVISYKNLTNYLLKQ